MSPSYLANLTRFGIKNPMEVAIYLKSPEGKAVLTMMEREIASLEALENIMQLKQQKKTNEASSNNHTVSFKTH